MHNHNSSHIKYNAPPVAWNHIGKSTLNEFAQLCHRSYSSFKRDFQSQYSESPGKWLLNKRLDYSVFLLLSSEKRVSDIVIDSGFVDISHYSKAFKKKFGDSPTIYRKNQPLS